MKIIKISATESTNDYLKVLSREKDLEDGTILVAHDQTKGRGQRQNSWVSKAGESLTFSVLKRFDGFPVSQKSALTFAVSIGMKIALDELQISSVEIKWPNDIMADGKKVAGILIENSLSGRNIQSSIIGIGLNVNEEEFKALPQATSMYLNTGRRYEINRVLEIVAQEVLHQLSLIKPSGNSELKQHYEHSLFRKHYISVFETETGKKFNGSIRGVTDQGELLVETEHESIQHFTFKEIKLHY